MPPSSALFLHFLSPAARCHCAELLTEADVGGSPVTTLKKCGLIQVEIEEVLRDPFSNDDLPELN